MTVAPLTSGRQWEPVVPDGRKLYLWSIDEDQSRPVGALVDRGDHVQILLPPDDAYPERYDAVESRLQADCSRKEWRPGDEGYLECVAEHFAYQYAIPGVSA